MKFLIRTIKPVGTVSEHLQASSYEIPWDVRIYTLPVNSRGRGPLAGLAGLAWKASERIRLQHGTYGKKKFFGRELDLINKFRNERPKGASLR